MEHLRGVERSRTAARTVARAFAVTLLLVHTVNAGCSGSAAARADGASSPDTQAFGGSTSGGRTGSGGTADSGGSTGATATGGATSSGGTSATGGTATATGGTAATGGTTATGGATGKDGSAPDASPDTSPDLARDLPAMEASADQRPADSGDAASVSTVEAVMRIQVDWTSSGGYVLAPSYKESSGTPALAKRSRREDPLGSFVGTVSDAAGTRVFQQTIGTGAAYLRELPSLTFRFPALDTPFVFTLVAENATTGAMEKVLEKTLDPSTFATIPKKTVEQTVLRAAKATPSLIVAIYSEGYLASGRDKFLADAKRVVSTLENKSFPGQERMEFRAVWSASALALGDPKNLGMPVPERDSFLGLYYPYWTSSYDSTYYLIVYPTRERRFRDGVGQVPYDYPIVLVDSSGYFGIGNYNEYTGVPAAASDFQNLLVHEAGHFFGLNEEYSTGGTELTFADGIAEPWSQNMTYQTSLDKIKWKSFISASTPVPTPVSSWNGSNVGAYPGGYGGVDSRSRIPVPDGQCTMSDMAKNFCPVCKAAIQAKVLFDLGE